MAAGHSLRNCESLRHGNAEQMRDFVDTWLYSMEGKDKR